ncbi:MAG: response regulator, partial [Pirellulales bacterium]|nr:response regulator [Pirellulales bacterium]
MGKSILILDDDVDFNSLLTDIFSQANYDVFSEQDPEQALKLFEKQGFDLVVTDQKMPNISGADFLRRIKTIRKEVPVIMVSGYLDNETIRDLIKEGVGGVFLKPLNVFSLLKRTAELIEESQNDVSTGGDEPENRVSAKTEYASSLPFKFRSYPCKSEVSASFAKKLFSLRNFKTNLLLVGEKGIAFKGICEDLRGFSDSGNEFFVYLINDQVRPERLKPIIEKAHEQMVERITFVLLEAQGMAQAEKDLVVKIARKEEEYGVMEIPVRMIFCLQDDLDTLYERGAIDENLYILMGTSEARPPALRECPEDIPILGQQYVVDAVTEKNLISVPRIDKTGRNWLKEQSWPDNHVGLRELISNTVGRIQEDLLSAEHFKAAMTEKDPTQADLSNEMF